MRVLLIAGGWSSEREVSLSGARQIESALQSLGHSVTFLDPARRFREILPLARRHDFAFINMHGSPGEDGLVQAILDKAGCPYQGSGPEGSFLALNKAAAKEVFEAEGIPTPEWALASEHGGVSAAEDLLLPVFVKPNSGGSSLGMSLVRWAGELRPALELVFGMNDAALVECMVPGTELTCGVLGETPLPLIMIKPKHGSAFFDYQNKYAADGADEICPAPVPDEVARIVQDLTLRAHRALGLSGYSRGDFIWDGEKAHLLEMNTLPGMTPTSLVPRAAARTGLDFPALIAELIRLGLEERGGRARS
ncbi:MAG: D-alanine--D-alanine ligase [Desulfovibrionaceae bacterium]|jgi:D-alanine-D-alanine ligase|uniref:D-alanine--D-alanine ligase family protein n=1 Tax=Desulfovibrio aminophilus TaxID=81425 RepID=UPI00040F1162|nr:D-alanine--D-alanine ligase [Desulfovibrio aminophilus]MDY0305362.1 D-alanine--D-alanine ligase [Desulfovibrionaceae bacterium]